MLKIPCHCGNEIESDLKTELNLETEPEIYTKIIEGSFMTFTCPKCGNEIKTEISVRLIDKKNDIDISFIPDLERNNYLGGQIKTDAKRVVIGYKELVEKIVIFGAKLDDRIIEIIKFRLLEKADSDNVKIYLNSINGDELEFYIHGLKPEQVGVSHIPVTVYNKIASELDALLENDDIKLFTTGAYVSVGRIYMED